MEYLATIVFERTPAGAVAIKAAGDAVPRQLRTLLLAIDGRSPVSQYVPFLTALAPLSDKFAELEAMGFARRRGVPTASTPPTAQDAPAPTAGALAESDLHAFASSFRSTSPAALSAAPADDFEAQLQAFAREQAFFTSPDALGTAAVAEPAAPWSAPVPPQRRPQLADALRDMQAYLSDAAGMEGLPVAMMLEQITSLAQLRRELPSYAALVASYGGDCRAHIASLTRLLDQAES